MKEKKTRRKKLKDKSLLSYYGFTKEEQKNVKKHKGLEKRKKLIISSRSPFLLEYEKEILQLSKHLPRKIIESLLKESQNHSKEVVDCVKKANELFKKRRIKDNRVFIGVKNFNEIVDEIAKSPKDFLLLLAYCSKPIECPLGRFSEKCKPIDHSVCNKCCFKEIVLKTKKIGCQCFIVTKDNLMFSRYLLPRFRSFINSKKYKPLLTVGCVWATNRFLRTTVIFGSIVMAYNFINGSCKNSKDYKEAELGKKNKVTRLNQKNWKEINYILDEVSMKIQYIKNHKHD